MLLHIKVFLVSILVSHSITIKKKHITVTTVNTQILGDKDDAIQFNEAQEVANSNSLNEDSEPEVDLPEVEVSTLIFRLLFLFNRVMQQEVEVKKRRHRKSTQQVDPMEEKKKKLLEMHPLKVELTFSVDNDGPTLVVVFSYYTKLRLVTVSAKVEAPKITGKKILGNQVCRCNFLIFSKYGKGNYVGPQYSKRVAA